MDIILSDSLPFSFISIYYYCLFTVGKYNIWSDLLRSDAVTSHSVRVITD